MNIKTQTISSPIRLTSSPQKPEKAAPNDSTPDTVTIDWSGSKPAHRDMKKMTRMVTAGTGALGLGLSAWSAVSSVSLGSGLVSAAIGIAATALAVTAVDLGSGLAHHTGDNYFPKQSLKHTQWHTEPSKAEYCMAGFSNKALDRVEFWPKWEKFVHKTTGAEPVSWQVPEYKAYCLGEISRSELREQQIASGMKK